MEAGQSHDSRQPLASGDRDHAWALAPVIEELAGDVEELYRRTRAKLDVDLPSYQAVDADSLRASVQRNLAAACHALNADTWDPSPADQIAMEQTVLLRIEQGLPVEDVIQGYRVSIGVIQSHFVEIATGMRLDSERILHGARLLWALSDRLTARAAIAYQRLGMDNALREAHLRSEFLRNLLTGRLESGELRRQSVTFGLDPGATYRAIHAHAGSLATVEGLRRELERHGSAPEQPGLVGVIGSECVGVVSRNLGELAGNVIAVGPPEPLVTIAHSFETATRVLAWMRGRGLTGAAGVEEISWRLAVPREPVVGSLLFDRYLAPLRAHGAFGAVLEQTVRGYLDHDRSVPATAAALSVHPNTLRYRLQRYEEITGRSVDSTTAVIELSWAFEVQAAAGEQRPIVV